MTDESEFTVGGEDPIGEVKVEGSSDQLVGDDCRRVARRRVRQEVLFSLARDANPDAVKEAVMKARKSGCEVVKP